jgi:hypothetical protein
MVRKKYESYILTHFRFSLVIIWVLEQGIDLVGPDQLFVAVDFITELFLLFLIIFQLFSY